MRYDWYTPSDEAKMMVMDGDVLKDSDQVLHHKKKEERRK
jgi:hypothetical protein